ncbi:MAG: LysM peptidoglycan-binding domain-containing protein [Thermodesulfobacteriota bacterium]
MEIHTRFNLRICIVIIIPFFFSGCITDIFHLKPKKQAPPEKIVIQESHAKPSPLKSEQDTVSLPKDEEKEIVVPANKEDGTEPTSESISDKEEKVAFPEKTEGEESLSPSEDFESDSESPSLQTTEKTSQEILDSALEFCQVSYDFWQQGDLTSATDALDQAYSLILEVSSDDTPEILQQRDDLRYTISKRIMEIHSSRFVVANGNNKVIPLVMNSHVERALTMFKDSKRQFFLDSYRRSGRYRPAILRALREAGLPEELSWLPLIESGFKIRALSRSRALGLWQFIASTGYKFGLNRDRWIDERMDPEKATMAAIAYLTELHQIFGDWTTALAAYNCGEGTVLRCIRTQKINYLDDFWDLYKKLPAETAFYVPKFLAVLHILNDPESHGITLPSVEEEIETEDVTINRQVHLRTISKQLEVPYNLLKDLNPALRHDYTPNRAYAFKVPKGKEVALLSKLDDIPSWHPPVSTYARHIVRKGESLSVIANKYRTTVRAIMSLNGLRSSHYIKSGWKLKIPTRRQYASSNKAPSPGPDIKPKEKFVEYVVRKGDSLWKIANQLGTTTKAIQSVNKLHDTHLCIGQSLVIPQDQSSFTEIATQRYTVLKGDSPYMIARKYRMNLSDFLKINKLVPRSTIYPGQVLLVKAN